LQRIGSDHPDLVLLDLLIRRPTALAVIPRPSSGTAACRPFPLVVMTVKRDVKTKIEALKDRRDDFIVKPFHFDELDAVMRGVAQEALPVHLPRARQPPACATPTRSC